MMVNISNDIYVNRVIYAQHFANAFYLILMTTLR